jgi:hypothetical protein
VCVLDYTCFIKQTVDICVISSTRLRNKCVQYSVGDASCCMGIAVCTSYGVANTISCDISKVREAGALCICTSQF